MEYSYHDRAPTNTLSVGELISQLSKLEPSLPVIFRSPFHGAFGSHQMYPIMSITLATLDRKEHYSPARICVDDETGEAYTQEEYTQVWNAWSGVIITCSDHY